MMDLIIPQAATPVILHERIMQFERFLRTLPQIEIPVEHFFAPGVYVRQIRIPAGAFLTGSVYKEPHIHTILQGRMEVATENGVVQVKGPYTFVALPGFKRAGYAYEDTIWQAAFSNPDNETDPEIIMARFIEGEPNVRIEEV
jgi:hypothetical protein